MKWDWTHFTGVDYDSRTKDHGIFKFGTDGRGKRGDWASDVSKELGNYDYLYVDLSIHIDYLFLALPQYDT